MKHSIRYFLQPLMSFFSLLCDAYILACSWSEYNTDYVSLSFFFFSHFRCNQNAHTLKKYKMQNKQTSREHFVVLVAAGLTPTYSFLQSHTTNSNVVDTSRLMSLLLRVSAAWMSLRLVAAEDNSTIDVQNNKISGAASVMFKWQTDNEWRHCRTSPSSLEVQLRVKS